MPELADKSLESWIWDAACSIRGAKDAAKYKDFILPLIFTKRLCGVFDDEVNRIAEEVGSRAKAFKLVKHDKKLVRFYLPLQPEDAEQSVWSVIRIPPKNSAKSVGEGERVTTHRARSPTRIRCSRGSSTAWTSTRRRTGSAIWMTTASRI